MFTRGQLRKWIFVGGRRAQSGQHTLGNGGSEDRLAVRDSRHGSQDLLLGCALEQVTTSARAHGLGHRDVVITHGENEHRHFRSYPTDLCGSTEPIGVRHREVHDDHVRLVDHRCLDRFPPGGSLADQVDAWLLGE
jgi:hypothetical protein